MRLNMCYHVSHVPAAVIYNANTVILKVFFFFPFKSMCTSLSGTMCVSKWKTAYQESLVTIKAFIGFLWPGHKDSCGRQQWV